MSYVDGFVTPVPTANREAYIEHARTAFALFRDHGALRLVEGWGDDVPDGENTDFRRSVQAGADEAVLFSWIEWPSREARDAGWAKVMADERMKDMTAPFDGKRMIYGGFAPVIDLTA